MISSRYCAFPTFGRLLGLFSAILLLATPLACRPADDSLNRENRLSTPSPVESPSNAPNDGHSFKILGGWPAPGVDGSEYYSSVEAVKEKIRAAAKKAEDLPRLFRSTVVLQPRTAYLEFNRDAVIADVGCGTGAMEVMLLLSGKPFKMIYALDPEPNSLEILRFLMDTYFPEQKEKIKVVQSQAENVMLPDRSIDLAILNDVHFFVPQMAANDPQMARGKACLRSLHQAMKPAGVVHVRQSSPFLNDWPTDESRIAERPNVRDELRDIERIFRESGFEVVTQTADPECRCYAMTLKP